MNLRAFVLFAAIAILCATTWGSALAQGFQVRPMSIDGSVPPGANVRIPIVVSSTSELAGRTLDVEVLQLSQTNDGTLTGIAYDEGGEVLPRSSAPWITAPETLQVEPRTQTVLDVQMAVPFAARGTYAAALAISAPPPDDATGLRMTLRLLIPIIVGIEGRPVRQDVRLTGATLSYRFDDEGLNPAVETPRPEPEPVTTLVNARIDNRGGTYSRFRGDLWVDVQDDTGVWRQIRRVPIEEHRLLPETSIAMPVDLGRLLPTGLYRVRGELHVDGRRTVPLRQEIAFEGHPGIEDLVTDIDLNVTPDLFEFAYQPRARRTGAISIENPSLQPIFVTLEVDLPDGMASRATAQLRGTDLSAAGWMSVAPQQFTLRPGQKRNVRLLAQFPEEPAAHQNHYAQLRVTATYEDGQSAGSATGLIEVTRRGTEDAPAVEIETARVSETDTSGEYALSLRATNTGDVLLRDTEVAYSVVNATGQTVVSGRMHTDIDAPILPLIGRSFGGTLDLSNVEAGEYSLLSVVRDAGLELAATVRTFVKSEDGALDFTASPSR